jgi:hypothetical protein
MSVETRRKQREPKTETEKALMAQKTKEGLQGLAIGPVTGLLGLPSDIIDLADMANDAIAKYGADTTIAQFSKLIKPQLDAVQEKYGRDAFDKGFTELTGIKSDPTRPAQFLGELVSLGALARGAKTGAKVIGETISDTYKGAKKLFEDSTLPPPDNLALETAGATKPVGQLEQTKKLLDKEKAVTTEAPNIIPPDEFMNAPKTTKMSMAGNRTPTGKQQIAKYRELDKTKKYNPDELFEMTGVYKGADGEFRWEIDTTEAELKSMDTIKQAKDGDTFALSSILKFDKLYQEYFEPLKVRRVLSRFNYKPIKNLSVVIRKATGEDGNALAAYTPSSDVITLYADRIYNAAMDAALKDKNFGVQNINELYKYQLESSLLHEVQHAIQGREGFTRGSSTQNFIRSGYEQDIKTNDELLDNAYFRFFNEFESQNALTGLGARDRLDRISNYVKLAFEENPNLSEGAIDAIVKAEVRNLDRAGVGLSDIQKEQVLRNYFSNIQRHYKNKKVLDEEYDAAYKSYKDVYGEKESNLVQDRFEQRRNLRSLMSMETGQATKSDIEKVQQEMLQKPPPSEMMGKTRAERERLDKLSRTDPETGKVKRKVSVGESRIYYHDDLNTEELIAGYIIEPRLVKADGTNAPSTKTAVSREELAARLEVDNAFQKASNKALDDKGYGDTVSIFRVITNKQDAMNLNNEQLVSGLLDKNKVLKLHDYLTTGKMSIDDESYLLKYNVPRSKIYGYLPAYKDKINRNINKKLKEKGIGQKKISGFETVTNPSEFTKTLLNAQDEIIASVGNIKPEVFTSEGFGTKGKPFNLNAINKMFIDEIVKGNINSPKDLMSYKPGFSFSKEVKRLQDIVPPIKDENSQRYIDEVKKFFDIKKMAKGGDMKKQMDLFQEGGLKDEGGTVDPVSGNDVPPGSTQEEVRDDIPAQLSEGEFVFPADVVRYIGLEKLMTLRQEAKAGLKRMEEMGQMGNSDEATLPDDIPFTIDDLDMEDELEYNEGGVVKAQTGTFVAPGSGVTTMPSQFAGQQLPSAGATPSYVAPVIPPPAPAPIGGFRPLTTSAQTGQQVTGTTPSFQTLIGTKPGQYDEFREYVNEAGMKLQIPFKDGQPIYPIPEGYTFVDPEEVKTEEVTTKEVTPQTTRVVEQDGGDDPDPTTTSAVDLTGAPLSYQSMFDMDKLDTALKDIAFGQLSLFDPKGAISRGVMGQVDINNVNLSYQKDLLTNFKSNLTGKYGKDFNLAVMDTFDRDRLANSMVELSQVTQNVLTDSNNKELNIDDLVSKANRMGMSVNKKDLNVKNTNILSKNKITQLAKNMITKELQQREASAKARRDFEVAADKATDKETIDTLSQAQKDVISAAKDMGISYGVPDISDTDSGTSDEGSPGMGGGDSGDTSGYTDDTGLGVGAKGGFFSKSKMTKQKPKVKKMKRGGLASRK